jgi:uncharacterized membrane protein
MKFFLIGLLIFYIGCQDYNSNTFDRTRYGEIEISGSARFEAAYGILQNRCMNCHRHSQWSGFTDEQDWVNNENLVVKTGNASDSQLIYRIINNGGASSDMPQGGQALPASEYDQLVDWVENIP